MLSLPFSLPLLHNFLVTQYQTRLYIKCAFIHPFKMSRHNKVYIYLYLLVLFCIPKGTCYEINFAEILLPVLSLGVSWDLIHNPCDP